MKKLLLPLSLILALSLSSCVKSAADVSESENSQPQTDAAESAEPIEDANAEEIPPEEENNSENDNSSSADIDSIISSMSLHEKICQMIITTPETLTGYGVQTEWDDFTTVCYEAFPVGGLILFDPNIESSSQLSKFVSDLHSMTDATGIDVFMGVDEEGGEIARLQQKLGTDPVSPMSYYGDTNSYDEAYAAGQAIGNELAEYGFNLDFAPVADVNINPANELGSRIFSSDPQIVADMSAAVIDGLHSCGVCTTLKHFPGLGAGDGNTHDGTVYIERSLEELEETEFKAFKGGIDAGTDFVMVGHQTTSASGENLQGDLSHVVVTDWLRDKLGYDGIIITDSHSMGAVINSLSSGDSAIMAVQAGVDMILMPYDIVDAVTSLEKAVESGEISEDRINDSIRRILTKKKSMSILSQPKPQTEKSEEVTESEEIEEVTEPESEETAESEETE